MPDEIPSVEQPDDKDVGGSFRPSPDLSAPNEPEVANPQAIPSDQLASAGFVDEEVERMMLEELARAGAADASDGKPGIAVGGTAGVHEGTVVDPQSLPTVKPVEFGRFDRSAQTNNPKNIDILMDVRLPVSIELGRTEMTIHDILDLGAGSVVELDKLAGEPVDLMVNNKVVAKGEVVVVDENFGLRVTSLISPEERIKSL